MLKNAPMRLLAVSCGTADTTKAHVHPRNCLDTRNTEETRYGRKRIKIAKYQRKLALKKRQLILKIDHKAEVASRQLVRSKKTETKKRRKVALRKLKTA